MSSRIKITLPDEVAARLEEMAAVSGEPVARVAGQMVRNQLAKLATATRGSTSAPVDDELSTDRPPWLEPYGGTANGDSSRGAGSSRFTGGIPAS
jgi:hypothetical protein